MKTYRGKKCCFYLKENLLEAIDIIKEGHDVEKSRLASVALIAYLKKHHKEEVKHLDLWS